MTRNKADAVAPARSVQRVAPLDPMQLRRALGCYATGVTIVTTIAPDGRPVGLTCNSFTSVSLEPPLISWNLGVRSPNVEAFDTASHFAINVLGEDQGLLALQFARTGGDKYTELDWRPGAGGAPILAGCIGLFECRRHSRIDGGDHVVYTGIVEAHEAGVGPPLLFSRGLFGRFVPG